MFAVDSVFSTTQDGYIDDILLFFSLDNTVVIAMNTFCGCRNCAINFYMESFHYDRH